MLISKRVSFSLGMFYPLKHPFEFVSWELQRVWFPLLCTHLAIPMNIFHCITFHNWSIAWWRYGRLLNMVARKIIKFYLSLFCPRPSQKTEPQVFVYFLLSNTHNMFRLTPWSHGIWFSTDKNYTEITRNWALLSLSLSGIERKWKQGKVSFKLHPLRGLRFVPLSLSSFVLEPLLVEKYSSSFHWSKDASFQLWLSTSQPL